MRRKVLLLLSFVCFLWVKADEGMWMLPDLKSQNAAIMYEMGLEIPIESVYHPDSVSLKDAVVHFGGGCTGEVISAQGLVLINHHCGYRFIQQHSSVEKDYLTDGFWAINRQEELPCRDLSVTFIEKIVEVTEYVKSQLETDEDPEGTHYLSSTYLNRVARRFADENSIEINSFRSVELKPFYGGNRYYLFIKKSYKDVRMVGAPPSSIGKFGADTDNWMWPRHTGDFALFRIYGTAEGEPAEYAETNIPLEVKNYMKISLSGVREGDFAFVMGFPGRNWRYMISDEVEERMETTNFMREHIRGIRQEILLEEMLKDDAVQIHYAGKYAASANYWKNAIGMNEGLVRLNILGTKKAQQQKLLALGEATGNENYRKAFEEIREVVAARRQPLYHQQALVEVFTNGMDWMKIPATQTFVSALLSKKKDRIAAEKEKLIAAADTYFESVPFPEVERKVAKALMKAYMEYIPREERITVFEVIENRFKGDSNKFIDDCLRFSIFGSRENFQKFIRKPTFHKIDKDWMVLFRSSINNGLIGAELAMEEINRSYALAHKVWVKGMMDMRTIEGIPIYPDANSTLRLTYGQVLSYEPYDGMVYDHYTTLKGVMEKEDPENFEFIVPDRLKELYREKEYDRYADEAGEMPVNFIVNTDNTGGNSGSPVLNAQGYLIGTAFDRNYEGLTGDIAFRPASQRAVCVDIRYTLFIIEKFAGAGYLLDEMEILQ
ncbi:MAG: S46 family peptidase [Bacteroides sp.]|nr:S46 family peptidase [Bacteroides sp.]